MAYARPGSATGQLALCTPLAHRPGCITGRFARPWVVCLRVDADQYLTASVTVVQNKQGRLPDSS